MPATVATVRSGGTQLIQIGLIIVAMFAAAFVYIKTRKNNVTVYIK
jgi:hypothetical protein